MRLPMMALAVAALLLAPVSAQAAQTSLFAEFQAVCLNNLENPLAARETALNRGFKPMADPRALGLSDGNVLYVTVTQSEDSPDDVLPRFSMRMCIMTTGIVSDDQLKSIADWAGTPPVREDGSTWYSFRLDGTRHVAVGADEAAQRAALKRGPIYTVQIRRKETLTTVLLDKMTLRP